MQEPIEDEVALLARLRAGDEGAFEELVRAHAPRLLAVARRILRDEEEARDAVQDAFLQTFRGLARFEGGSRLGTWLYRIGVNAALMRLRTLRRRREESLEESQGALDLAAPESGGSDLEARRQRALAAIGQLPEAYRGVLTMSLGLGLGPLEMAPRLGLTPAAAKVRLHRGRRALARLVRPGAGPLVSV